jgi:hypothetical protein
VEAMQIAYWLSAGQYALVGLFYRLLHSRQTTKFVTLRICYSFLQFSFKIILFPKKIRKFHVTVMSTYLVFQKIPCLSKVIFHLANPLHVTILP